MGEVYRAHDTTLGRDVAIKIVRNEFAADAERLARFRREAQLLAAINHPNIAAIYGVEESTGIRGLVLELVDGPTLADWIAARSPLPRSRASGALRPTTAACIEIARQIAQALDAAHERGIVHRDLKPGNVKVGPDGFVKVLDFGLAKITATHPSADQGLSPTVSVLDNTGVILGTAPYMSPEQARGSVVDRRTDIWAFGCILYEMLSGRPAFPIGETTSDTLAGVLTRDPDWTLLPADTPPRLVELIERCLRKDPRERLRDIGDASHELEAPSLLTAPAPSGKPPARRRGRAWAALAVVAIAAALTLALVPRSPPRSAGSAAFTVEAPQAATITVGQPLSPDGRKLAFVAPSSAGIPRLWVRPLDSLTAEALEGTDGASSPFWSPDSGHLAFFAGGSLKRIPATGGAVQTICAVDQPVGGSWGSGGIILIGGREAIFRVPASGGSPTPVTRLDVTTGEQWHTAPDFLPDGRHFIYTARSGGLAIARAYVAALDSEDRRPLSGIASTARFAPTGHILFYRGTALMAWPFDVDDLALSGEPFQVAPEAAPQNQQLILASVSSTGSLAYLAAEDTDTELRWFDRTGKDLGLAAPRGSYLNPELSPDETRVAVDRAVAGNVDIYTVTLATPGNPTSSRSNRITIDPAADFMPVWAPRGELIAFSSYRGVRGRLYERAVDAAGSDDLLQEADNEQRNGDWSRDGRWLVYSEDMPPTPDSARAPDIWAVSLDESRTKIRVTNTPFAEQLPRLSPDGRWIAYEVWEASGIETYVQAFPDAGARQQVSFGGGRAVRWSHDGTELFYLAPDGTLMAVSVAASANSIELGDPTPLFRAPVAFTGLGRVLNNTADGRFLLNTVPADRARPSIVVLHDWRGGLL